MAALGKAGYSLIELFVAMTLFAIAALSLSAGVVMVLRSGVLSDDLTHATLFAQEKLEELAIHTGALTGGADTPQPPFTRDWTVSLDDPEIGLTSITVTVSWQRDGEQAVSLMTIVNQ